MKFLPTPIAGCHLVELEKRGDERGFFARFFCAAEFSAAGLHSHFPQMNDSLSARRGTLRGMHYQLPPSTEVKVVRCIGGALFDVALDLRPDSPSFGQWFGAELSAENRRMMYLPAGCAHGFVTLTENAEALYLSGANYDPAAERGVRFDDPRFNIAWPLPPAEISAKDASWPDFDPDGFHATAQLRGPA